MHIKFVKKMLACICSAAIALTLIPANSFGDYSPTIEAEAATEVYVVEDLRTTLKMETDLDTLAKNYGKNNDSNASDRQKATQEFVNKYQKQIIFDQETNAFYYASGSRSASTLSTFRTVGYELKIDLGDETYNVDVLRKPNDDNKNIRGGEYYLKDVAEYKADGNTYNLFRVKMDDLNAAFEKRGRDFAAIFYASGVELNVTADAYLVKCYDGEQLAWVKDTDGDGKINENLGMNDTSLFAHTKTGANNFGMNIETGNYFGKKLKLKPNAYKISTDNVSLTSDSTSGAYYTDSDTTNAYYINGNVNSNNKYYFKFTGTSQKSKAVTVEEDDPSDFDLIFGRLDITTKSNLDDIYDRYYNAATEDGKKLKTVSRLLNTTSTEAGVASYAVTVPEEKTGIYTSKKAPYAYKTAYSSNATIFSRAGDYTVTTKTENSNRTNKLTMSAGFTVKNELIDDTVLAVTPYVKAMRSPDNTKGISSDRYDKDKALYLIPDKTAPRANKSVETVTENNITYYRFKIADDGSGVKSATSASTKAISIKEGNGAENSYGIKRNTTAYVYIRADKVIDLKNITITLTDNVGNSSDITVTIPKCGLFYYDRGVFVVSDIVAEKSNKFTIAGSPETYNTDIIPKTYHSFVGWRFRGSFSNKLVASGYKTNAISGFYNLDAEWTANPYTVVFHSNAPANCSTKAWGNIEGLIGFDQTVPKTVYFNCTSAVNCSISLPGYTFQGWYGDAGCAFYPFGIDGLNYGDGWQEGSQYGIEPDVNGQIHLYAKWEPIDIGIYFDLNKPTNGVNHTVTSSSNPSFTEGSTNYVVVKFDSNIAGVPNATLHGWHDASTGKDVLTNWFQYPARNNTGAYLCEGTKIDASLVGNPDVTGNIVTFYAQWDPNTYTIQYMSNAPANASTTSSSIWGWSQEPQIMTYDVPGKLNALDLNTPSLGHNTDVLPGYTWKHWSLDNGKTYQNNAEVLNLTADNNGKIMMYAQWTPNTYAVSFNANKPTTDNNTHASTNKPVVKFYDETSNDKIVMYITWDSSFNGKVPTSTLTGWHARYDADGVTDAWYMGNNYKNPGNKVSNAGTFDYGTVGYPGNKDVYAQWQANWYYICYHENGQGSVTKGSIQNEKSLETQVKEHKKYMTEYAYTNTFEKCIQSSMRNSKNTRIHIYDVEDKAAGSQFIRYDDGVAGEQKEHYSNNEKTQLTEYSETDYEKYGLPDVSVSYLNHNTTWNTKYDYDFLGWDMGTAYKDDGTHQWNYNAGAAIKNLTSAHRASIDMYAFWNAFPNYDAAKDTTHFSVYEGADITMQMLKDKVQVWDKEQEDVSDTVVVEEITYKDGTKVTKPAEEYLLDTSVEKIGEYTVTFRVTDNRGDRTYLTGQGNIVFNNEPVIAELDGRFLYLEDIKDVTPEQEYELLKRPVVRTDVEDDAYEAEEFLQKDDLFLGKVEAYTGFGQAIWYREITALTRVSAFTREQKQEGLNLLHEDMKTLTQTEADTGKTFSYICYTNDMFKKQMERNGSMTIIDTQNDDIIPENAIRRRVRFINDEYLDTLPADWQNSEKRKALEESLEKGSSD